MKNRIQAKIEYPETNSLERNCKWGRPAFETYDGFCEAPLWQLNGLVVALGFIDDERHSIIGSGIMVAPGLCLTATHVIEETKNKQALIHSFVNEESMRIWKPEDFHAQKGVVELLPFQKGEDRYSDVAILSCSPFSSFLDKEDLCFSPVEVCAPKIGERLWSVGYRETSNDSVLTIGMFISSGPVTNQYLEGRGNHIKGPCIEVAMKALGGMSGGAVFNSEGRIVGVISSCLEGQSDDMGPTYVSLVWPSLVSKVYTPWPENYWPNNEGGLQVKSNFESARVIGSAESDEDGTIRIKFPEQSDEEILEILKLSNISLIEPDDEFIDFAYENFEDALMHEGLEYLSKVTKEQFNRSLVDNVCSETIKLFKCVGADCIEGLEDLDVKSVSLLENGSLSIDATFNIRGVSMKLEMMKNEHDYYSKQIEELHSFHNFETDDDKVTYEHYIRPYFRVNFAYNPNADCCENISFQMLVMRM